MLLSSIVLSTWAATSVVAQSADQPEIEPLIDLGEVIEELAVGSGMSERVPVPAPPDSGVWLARIELGDELYVNDKVFPAPTAVLTVDVAADDFTLLLRDPDKYDQRKAVAWERPPAPLFIDPRSLSQVLDSDGAIVSDRIRATVFNATDQVIPLLFVVTGGTAGFDRKRAPLRQGLPPWGHAVVELPLGVTESSDRSQPLYVSVGGINGVDPTVQFVRHPSRFKPVRRAERPFWVAAGDGPEIRVERPQRSYSDESASIVAQVEQFHTSGVFTEQVVAWTLQSEQLTFEIGSEVRLVRVNLSPACPAESIHFAGQDTVWQRGHLGNRFWLKSLRDEDGNVTWQAGLFPPPATERHFERGAGLGEALAAPALFIVGTGGGEELARARLDWARVVAARWTYEMGGLSPMLLLDEQAVEALKYDSFDDHTLVLFGNASECKLWTDLVPKNFAFQFDATGVWLGGKLWAGAGTAGVVYAQRGQTPHGKLVLCSDAGMASLDQAATLRIAGLGLTDFLFTKTAPAQRGRFDHAWRFQGHGAADADDERPR